MALSTAAVACNGVSVNPSVDLQAVIDANPEGTTFCLRSGLYHLAAPIVVKTNDSLIGEPGAVLSGAIDISKTFQASGSYWVVTNMTMEGYDVRPCKGGSDVRLCHWLNDVYYDNAVLKRVDSLGELRSGAFYFDYPNDKIYIGDNPSGHVVEVGVTTKAIATLSVQRYPKGVILRGLTFEKFASGGNESAVEGFSGWLVEGNTFRLNHSTGLDVGRDSIVRNNAFIGNGRLGFGVCGYWTNILFEDNWIASNNYAGYDSNWGAGGVKFYAVSGLTVRNNVSLDNVGVGLWTDWESSNVLYEGNWVEGNTRTGIFHEAGYDAVIRGNLVAGNGFDHAWIDGSGILVNSSRNVEIVGNTLQDNYQAIGATATDRGTGSLGPRVLQNLFVHGNTVRVSRTPPDYWAVAAGITGDPTYAVLQAAYNNRWQGNRYVVCSHIRFFWKAPVTWKEWQAAGMDTTGSMTLAC